MSIISALGVMLLYALGLPLIRQFRTYTPDTEQLFKNDPAVEQPDCSDGDWDKGMNEDTGSLQEEKKA